MQRDSPPAAATSSQRHLPWIERLPGAIVLAVIAASLCIPLYRGTLLNPFVYDDRTEVLENQPIRLLPDVGAVVRANPTRPVLMLSYAINYSLGELDPFVYHLTNVALHAVNVLLVFALILGTARDHVRAGGRFAAPVLTAFGAASLFAVHPMMTEAVSYVSGRSELLSALFFLSSMLCFRRAFQPGRAMFYLPALVLFVAGLGTKETMAMLPIVLLAYDRLVVRPAPHVARRRLWFLHVPLLLLIAAGGVLRVYIFTTVEHSPSAASFPWQNLLVELYVFMRYLGLFVYPAGQSLVHSVDPITRLTDWRVFSSVAMILLLAVTMVALRKRLPHITFGLLWFFCLLVPSAAIIVLAPVGEPMSEHRTYLASVGLFVAVAAPLSRLIRLTTRAAPTGYARVATPALGIAFVVLLGVLAALTSARNQLWRDPVLLWEDAAAKAPRTWSAMYGRADAYRAIGDNAAAIDSYQQAIRLRPTLARGYLGLAETWLEMRRFDAARQSLSVARTRLPYDTQLMVALAKVDEVAFQDTFSALQLCRQALAIDPRNAEAAACVQRIQQP
jgi:hypothetical protein